jgi:hypothetical protein
MYGCEAWCLTLREEHRLRMFENRVLRRIFETMGNEVMEGCRKLHNEELHRLYSSPHIMVMKEDEIVRECSSHGGNQK